MKERIVKLKPFLNSQQVPQIEITCFLVRETHKLKVSYLLQGDLSKIILPSPKETVTRKNELWQTTCFELFLAIFNAPEYWEVNLAPTGDWNVYYFTNYRRGMKEAKAFEALPLKIFRDNLTYKIVTEINLKSIITSENTLLDIALTTIIKDTNQNISYWAIHHPGTQPDFHRRDSFITI